MFSHQTPVFHGTTLEICNGDGVVLGQRVTDAEVVLVERDGFDAHLQRELALLKLTKGKNSIQMKKVNKRFTIQHYKCSAS